MTESIIRVQLAERNPFFSGSAANPWDNTAPDVVSLNSDTFKHICGLIAAKDRAPREPLAGVVLGEAGIGKTHLLKRLLAHTRQNNMTVMFVSVRPFLNPKRRLRHLLQEIAANLARMEVQEEARDGLTPKKKKVNQFEFLVARIIGRYLKEKTSGIGNAVLYFQERFPGINKNLLQAIFDYRDDVRRSLILNWLGGGINEDFVSVLNFPDREKMDSFEMEEEAAEIVRSLGVLLEYCGMSMVVCFDQLDGMREASLILALNDVAHFLINDVSGILPLAFARTQTWHERLRHHLDIAVYQRLSSNTMRLEGCSIAQAQELIRVRIEAFFREASEDKYQWLIGRLEGKLQEGYAPRLVIELANREITLSPEVSRPEPSELEVVFGIFADEYQQERDRVAADFDLWPPDTDRLQHALEVFLTNRVGFDSISIGDEKYISLTARHTELNRNPTNYAFIINTAEHPSTVRAAFKRGVGFLEKHGGGRCYYITDARCKFPGPQQWKKVHEVRSDFEARGGIVLVLDRERAVDWYGLMALIFKLKAEDILLPAATGFRAATMDDFTVYMRNRFAKDLLQPVASGVCELPSDDNGKVPVIKEEELEQKIIDFLQMSPMKLKAATFLLGELIQSGEAITYEVLLEFVHKRSNLFFLYPNPDGSCIQLIA